MKEKSMKFKNWRWWLCLPILIACFVVLFSLFVIGEILVLIGNFIQSPYHSDTPRWLRSIEGFINTK